MFALIGISTRACVCLADLCSTGREPLCEAQFDISSRQSGAIRGAAGKLLCTGEPLARISLHLRKNDGQLLWFLNVLHQRPPDLVSGSHVASNMLLALHRPLGCRFWWHGVRASGSFSVSTSDVFWMSTLWRILCFAFLGKEWTAVRTVALPTGGLFYPFFVVPRVLVNVAKGQKMPKPLGYFTILGSCDDCYLLSSIHIFLMSLMFCRRASQHVIPPLVARDSSWFQANTFDGGRDVIASQLDIHTKAQRLVLLQGWERFLITLEAEVRPLPIQHWLVPMTKIRQGLYIFYILFATRNSHFIILAQSYLD